MKVIGIDEAGRGPLAGPVTVGAFCADEKVGKWIVQNLFENRLRDSKKLNKKKREEIYKKMIVLRKEGRVDFAFAHISNKVIDTRGISEAARRGIDWVLDNLNHSLRSPSSKGRRGEEISPLTPFTLRGKLTIRLDGLLKAPKEYKNQKTIIKGDEKDVFIACSSIVAKVERDRLMSKLSKKYPNYGFDIHKGYGTLAHRQRIQKLGLTKLHRVTYCKNII